MPVLNYLTRGNQSPKGKSNVYICAHSLDYQRYLDKIAKYILEIKDCSIWYDGEPDGEYTSKEEWQDELGAMNVFVVLVSREFLFKDNKAYKDDFKIAQRNNIPILPLIMEDDIMDAFNEKCGYLHALIMGRDYVEQIIKNKEKLKEYLDSVLVADTLKDRILNEAENMMFLSYRKKNRKQALQLMTQIHEIEEYRDIPIWFDEFIEYGERFDDVIQSNLGQSKVFTMVVTPNILERNEKGEKNYVMDKEYPRAKELEKKIVPVEMIETDLEELKVQYGGIPECIPREDNERLFKTLQDIYGIKSDKTDEQEFLLGVAYLNSILREKNPELAVEILTNVADKNYVEAVRKLVQIYRYGQGVEADWDMAIRWQKKLIDIIEKKYHKNKTIEDAEELIWACTELGIFYKQQKMNSQVKLIFGKIKNFIVSEKMLKKPTGRIIHLYIQASMEIIDIINESAKTKNMKASLKNEYSELLKLCQKGKKRWNDGELLYDMFSIYVRRAMLSFELETFGNAKADFEEAYRLLNVLKESLSDDIYNSSLISLLERRGELYKVYGRKEFAEADFKQAIAFNEQWYETEKSEEAFYSLSIGYEKLGDFYRDCVADENAWDMAITCFEKSIQITKELCERCYTIQWAMDLAAGYRRIGGIKELQRKYEEADEYYQKGVEILELLQQETDSVQVQSYLAYAYDDLGDINVTKLEICVRMGDEASAERCYESAKEYYEKALHIRNMLHKKGMETSGIKRQLQLSYDRFGLLALRDGNLERSRKNAVYYFEKELEICKELAEEAPENVDMQRELFVAYVRLGSTYLEPPKDTILAKEYFEKALKTAESMGEWMDARTTMEVEKVKEIVSSIK